MTRPSGDLLFYAVILIGGGIYLVTRLPTIEPRYQALAIALAAYVVIVAVLLLVRFRWSPELIVALLIFMLGWGVIHGIMDGFNRNRIGMTIGAILGFFGYLSLRREVRGPKEDEAA
jgi:uncharacterized membrane protein YdjX (TVP38/TMEM64 family)